MIVPVKWYKYVAQGNEIVMGCAIASIFLRWTTVKSGLILIAFSGGDNKLSPLHTIFKNQDLQCKDIYIYI